MHLFSRYVRQNLSNLTFMNLTEKKCGIHTPELFYERSLFGN